MTEFQNESTWFKAVSSGKQEEFHSRFEETVEKVKLELGHHHPMIIGGEEGYSSEGEFVDTSPADTRVILGYFQKGTRKDVRDAIDAALNAFEEWAGRSYVDRITILRKIADTISSEKFELAALMSMENGKNRFEAIGDVDEAIDLIRYYCTEYELNKGFEREMGRAYSNERSKSILKPYGVWGVISPFNFPLAIAVGMNSGALITGNTVVFKPASDTPYMGLKFVRIAQRVGIPDGVLNYITGAGSVVGVELVENSEISGVVFTGSRDVGVESYRMFAARSPRPFIAEMGGKNAVIVTAKADLDKAVEGVARAAFGYGGQKCSACSRVYVHKSVKNRFTEKLIEKTKSLKIGNPLLKDTFLGPLINRGAYEKFQKFVDEVGVEGRVIVGGNVLLEGDFRYGYYVEPTIVDDAPKDSRFFKEELFVPILFVANFDTLDEAIKHVNDVDYGLTAGIFSEDLEEQKIFFDKVQAGVLYVNRRLGATTGAMVGAQPFVGWKLSGSSGKGAGGPYYLQQFMREQTQTIAS